MSHVEEPVLIDELPGDVWIFLFNDGRVLYGKNSFHGPHWRATLVLRVRGGEVMVVKDHRIRAPIVATKEHLGPAILCQGIRFGEE